MKILALDLGNKTGYALYDGKFTLSNTANHKNSKLDVGHQYLNFSGWLKDLIVDFDSDDEIYYEDVRRHLGTDAAHVYGGYLAILQSLCYLKGIRPVGVAVGTIKKNWTGKGNATKQQMIAEAKRRGFDPVDDNEADALAILDYAKTNFNK